MSYYTVYEIKNKVTGKTYIGKHKTDNIYDDYLGSGKYLKRSIKKYGKDCFEKVIIYVFDNKEDMETKEEELVNDEYVKNKNTYNLKKGGKEGGWDYINDKENSPIFHAKTVVTTKIKHGDDFFSIRGKAGVKKQMDLGIHPLIDVWSKSDDPEIKKRRSEIAGKAFRGQHHTEETKKKIGNANSIHQQGKGNSQYGTCWIYKDKENKKIKKDDLDSYLEHGWIRGRKIKI